MRIRHHLLAFLLFKTLSEGLLSARETVPDEQTHIKAIVKDECCCIPLETPGGGQESTQEELRICDKEDRKEAEYEEKRPEEEKEFEDENGDQKLGVLLTNFEQVVGIIVSTSLAALQTISPGSPYGATTILQGNLVHYIRYLSINYPPKLTRTFRTNSLKYGLAFPKSLIEEVQNYRSPPRFDKFINGLFLVNFWDGFITALILFLCICLIFLLKGLFSRRNKFIAVVSKVQGLLMWNYIIIFLISNAGRVTIFAIVEFQTLQLGRAVPIISFVMNLFFVYGSVVIIGYIPKRLFELRREYEGKPRQEKIDKHECIKVLFERFKDESLFQEIFMFIIAVRAILHSIVITSIDCPTVQCSILIVLNLMMLCYLIGSRPFICIIGTIEMITYEVILFVTNSTCLYLSALESKEQFISNSAGTTLIVCNIVALAVATVMTVLKLLILLISIIKKRLATRKLKNLEVANQDVVIVNAHVLRSQMDIEGQGEVSNPKKPDATKDLSLEKGIRRKIEQRVPSLKASSQVMDPLADNLSVGCDHRWFHRESQKSL